jgi:uncharacterized protein (TIGR03067 family)
MNALLIALTLFSPADARKDDDAKKELANLQGVWKPTSVDSAGRQIAGERLTATARYTLVIAGNGYALGATAGIVTLDPAQHHIDLVVTDGRTKGATLRGLYELTGDTLKLTTASGFQPEERPKELKAGAGQILYTFERDTKATKEQAEAKLKELKEAVANQPAGFPRANTPNQTQEMLKQILERLDRIEKRLDAMEKKPNPAEKK